MSNYKSIRNLKELFIEFSDEQKCRDLLVQQRWNGSPICPYCGSNNFYVIEGGKRFKCGNKECYKKYSVTVGTIFHASNIPLSTWFGAVYLLSSHKKGISSCQVAKDLGVSQKTAWFMLHRIRESLNNNTLPLLKNTVEVDEIYIGGKIKNMPKKKKKELRDANPEGYIAGTKTMVIGMLERGGNLKLEVAGSDEVKINIIPTVFNNVEKSAVLMTDGDTIYPNIGKHYAAHHSVNHTIKEYVRDGEIHTNSIEGVFGLFRRMIIGTYHKMSPKHLARYCGEMQYRYNTRKAKEGNRFEDSLTRIETRLSWKQLTKDNGLTAKAIIEPDIPKIKVKQGEQHEVLQILEGEVVGRYPSIKVASQQTGVGATTISKAVRGKRVVAGGYQWKYS